MPRSEPLPQDGSGGVFIGVLNDKDNWKREDVGRPIREGETYTTRFKVPYPGQWKMAARLAGRVVMDEAANLVQDPGDPAPATPHDLPIM